MVRILFKIGHLIGRVALNILYKIDHRAYMACNVRFLKCLGINISGELRYINFKVKFDGTNNYSLISLGDNCVITGSTVLLIYDYGGW